MRTGEQGPSERLELVECESDVMMSVYQSKMKSRADNSVDAADNTSRDFSSCAHILSLPADALRCILADSIPSPEYQRWEWISAIRQTCKTFRELSSGLKMPNGVRLADFAAYDSPFRPGESHVDIRSKILIAFRRNKRMTAGLTELHVNWLSVLPLKDGKPYNESFGDAEVFEALRALLTTPASLPDLNWLDINISSDYLIEMKLVDASTLVPMSAALPSLRKLTLGGCFNLSFGASGRAISPSELQHFFTPLQCQLTSLSLYGTGSISDEHIAAFLPLIGKNLTRLELIQCNFENELGYRYLTDTSMTVIARECCNLESFAITDSYISTSGLSAVLRANTGIVTLNLSRNNSLSTVETAGVIAQCVPHIHSLRNNVHLWKSTDRDWVLGGGLKALIDAQLRISESSQSEINLKTLGIGMIHYKRLPTDSDLRSLRHALEKGVRTVEIVHKMTTMSNEEVGALSKEFPHVSFVPHSYPEHVDGSECNSSYQGSPYDEPMFSMWSKRQQRSV